MIRMIFLGAPGSGKGTQAKKLCEKLDLAHISTGDILRKAIKDETELGKNAKRYVDGGELVPDDIILKMIKEELTGSDSGFIFDGFPRTFAQAEGLEKLLGEMGMNIDRVINLLVDDQVIIARLVARRLCKSCGFEYNSKTRPPKQEGLCDHCGGELFQRSDDNAEVINNRLNVYREKTKPIEEFYRARGLLLDVDGGKGFEEVFESIVEMVGTT
ncbi:MAG: adenylate kinase [candidate division Zixibacteria bacterium]